MALREKANCIPYLENPVTYTAQHVLCFSGLVVQKSAVYFPRICAVHMQTVSSRHHGHATLAQSLSKLEVHMSRTGDVHLGIMSSQHQGHATTAVHVTRW